MEIFNDKGQKVGDMLEGWFIKRNLNELRHQLRKPPAWGTDSEHINLLIEQGGKGVVIKTTQGNTWISELADWVEHAFEESRGHGLQMFLPLKYWEVE